MREAACAGVKPPGATQRVPLIDHLREVDPGPWLKWWHVGAMVERVQAVLDGEIERLIICAPPRTWKSRPVVQGGTSCRLRNEPRAKVMVACASDDLVRYHSRHAKEHLEASGVKLRQDSKAVELWETEAGGTYKAVTVQAGRLGFGWDLGVIDDPFKSLEDAKRVLVQRRVWSWYRDDFMSRAQARPEGGAPGQILIHQRLDRHDLVGRLLAWLEESTAEEWHALILKGYQERTSVVLPPCVTVAPDPREPGAPLCDDPETMRLIDERRRTNPGVHRSVDQQDPPDDKSGGVFCGTWFRRLAPGQSMPDYGEHLESILGPMTEARRQVWDEMKSKSPGAPGRILRGWDFSAGGSDATASAKGGPLPGDRWRWLDCTEDYPAPASVQRLVVDMAERDGKEVEQVIPQEVAIGKLFSDQIADLLRRLGFTVHLAPQRGPKRSRSLAHAACAAAVCTTCRRLIVPEDSMELFRSQGVCQCPEPGGDGYGRVELDMPREKADLFVARHNAFTGEEGGQDDVVDAAAVAFNVGSGPPPVASWGRIDAWAG